MWYAYVFYYFIFLTLWLSLSTITTFLALGKHQGLRNEYISVTFVLVLIVLIIVWWEWRLYVFMEVCQAIFLSLNSSGFSAIPLFLCGRLTTGYMEECYWCSIIAVGAVSEGAGCLTHCLWLLLSWPNTHHIVVILWFMFPLFFPDYFTESQIIALWLCQFLMIDVSKLYGLISSKTRTRKQHPFN